MLLFISVSLCKSSLSFVSPCMFHETIFRSMCWLLGSSLFSSVFTALSEVFDLRVTDGMMTILMHDLGLSLQVLITDLSGINVTPSFVMFGVESLWL